MPSTMASSTHCWPSLVERLRQNHPQGAGARAGRLSGARLAAHILRMIGRLAACLLVCGQLGAAVAAEFTQVRQASIVAAPQGYQLDAALDVALNPTLVDALERGVHLHFLLELDISRPRGWWWFDEDIVSPTRKLHLYYHLLLRRYIVETGYTTRTVPSLTEALALLGQVDDWQVLERGGLKPGQRYDARLRLRLDTSQLPKTLSIGAVTSDKWALASPWYNWSFEAPALPPLP